MCGTVRENIVVLPIMLLAKNPFDVNGGCVCKNGNGNPYKEASKKKFLSD